MTTATPGRELPRTPISPVATREDLIAMIHNRDALVSDLKEALASARLAAKPADEGVREALDAMLRQFGGREHKDCDCAACSLVRKARASLSTTKAPKP